MAAKLQSLDVCPDGEHRPVWDSALGETVCERCGNSGTRIVNFHHHDLY